MTVLLSGRQSFNSRTRMERRVPSVKLLVGPKAVLLPCNALRLRCCWLGPKIDARAGSVTPLRYGDDVIRGTRYYTCMTKVYIIAYDLLKAGQDYNGLRAALETYDCCPLQQSVYLVCADESSRKIYHKLIPYIDANDNLLIAEVTNNYCGQIDHEQAAWLKQRLTCIPD